MADGRLYWSSDNWHTIYLARPNPRQVVGEEADLVRFLVVNGAAD
jgi:hypothetical protein